MPQLSSQGRQGQGQRPLRQRQRQRQRQQQWATCQGEGGRGVLGLRHPLFLLLAGRLAVLLLLAGWLAVLLLLLLLLPLLQQLLLPGCRCWGLLEGHAGGSSQSLRAPPGLQW